MAAAVTFEPFDVPRNDAEARLLSLIHAAPDDDAPRLVWADFLEEHGGAAQLARARLVRLQCAGGPLAKGVKTVLSKFVPRWTKPFRFADTGLREWHFERGFPHRLTLSAEKFAKVGTALLDALPTVQALRFHEASNELEALGECEALRRVPELDLSAMCSCRSCPIDLEVGQFVGNPRLASVKRLSLAKDRLGPAQMTALAKSKSLTALERLDLADNPLNSRGVLALSKGSFPRLVELDLSRTGVNAVGLKALFKLPSLRRVVVIGTPVAEQAAQLAAASGRTLEVVTQAPVQTAPVGKRRRGSKG